MSKRLKIGGKAFDARVISGDEIFHIYYDSKFKDEFAGQKGLITALEQFVKTHDEYDGQEIAFHGDASDGSDVIILD